MQDRPSRRAFLQAVTVAGASCNLPALVRSSIEAATYSQQGLDHFWRGNLKDALVSLTKALEMDPTNEEALDTRSAVFEALGNHERAMHDRNEIIRLDPSAQAFLMRGVYSLGHDPALALADFTEVIRQEPLDADAFLFRALAYEEQGEYGLALADLAMNARLDPENAEWLAEDVARVRRLKRQSKRRRQ